VNFDEFTADDFDAPAFVLKACRRAPLPKLQETLHEHSSQVKKELQQLLNDKYSDFVSLAQRMQTVDRIAAPLRNPLLQQQRAVVSFHAQLQAVLDQAKEAREERRRIVTERRKLEVYVQGVQTLEEVKTMRARVDAGERLDFLQRHSAFECIARSLQRLRADVDPYRDIEMFAPLITSFTDIETEFADCLVRSLGETVDVFAGLWATQPSEDVAKTTYAQSALALAYLSRNLQTLGLTAKVTQKFHEVFVKKAIEAAEREDLQAAGQVGLDGFFKHIDVLLAENSLFLYIMRLLCVSLDGHLAYSVPGLELASTALGVPVLDSLMKSCAGIFMPAVSDVFVINYLRCEDFLRRLEVCMDTAERHRWRGNSVLQDFRNKWKIQIYFSVRDMEVTTHLDMLMPAQSSNSKQESSKEKSSQAATAAASSAPAVRLCGTQDVMNIVRHLWAPTVYLYPLFPRFLKLSLEIFARYFKQARDAGKSLTDEKLTAVISDVFQIRSEIQTSFLPLIEFPPGETERHTFVRTLTQSCIDETAAEAEKVAADLGKVLQDAVFQQICQHYLALKGIPPLYRMTSRPAPTSPSAYVDVVVKTLQQFQARIAVLPENISQAWIAESVDRAMNKLAVDVGAMLESLEQQEKSLQKLRAGMQQNEQNESGKGKRTGLPPNIFKQLRLDVESFQSQCSTIFVLDIPTPDIPYLYRDNFNIIE